MTAPLEPEPTNWQLPSATTADEHGLVGVGADLAPGTLLAAYRAGLFPMPMGRRRLGWWSPDPRGVLPLDGVRVSRSLRASLRRFEVRRDTRFSEVMRRCGDPRRPHGWINDEFVAAYTLLHELGWAHSFEVYRDDVLVGGLYGVRIGGLFAGESMFHADPPAGTDASKVAVVATVQWLRDTGGQLFDVQWSTPHLASLGVIDVPRTDYLRRLATATA
ncbi:MAG: leucyl/phenylalanyl-tRNA--protein transferase [Actinomycetota bacterium]|nr:leucyl/phenylalanyl-tRNA--protein transferase [Actinomycetota bacterium]